MARIDVGQHNAIKISGKATSYNAVTNFYNNLSDSGYFGAVVLGRTFEVQEGVAFSIDAGFAGLGSKEPEEPQG